MATQNQGKQIRERIINVRKLAALDIVFHGPRFILIEFGGGVLLCLALGLWLTYIALPLSQDTGPLRLVTGLYILTLATNYTPLLIYAILIERRKSAQQEVAAELAERDRYTRMYGVQQALLLVPLAIPVLALVQEARARSKRLPAESDR